MSRSPDRFWHPARRTIRRAHSAIAAHWRRLREPQQGSIVLLDDVRLRLEHYLRAMYGRTIRVESVTETHDANWSRRARRHFGLMRAPTSSESDELCIRLPSRLGNDRDGVTALQRYRVLAVQHAERIHRASAAHAAGAASMLERDLFLLAESVAVNATLATNQPGLRRELSAARASALAQRTMPNTLTHVERRVETMIRSSLAAAASDERVPHRVSAAESAAWARETATALEQEFRVEMRRYYRGVSPIALWGTSLITRLTGVADSATAQERRVVDASNAPAEPKREATRQMSPSPSSTPDAQLQDADGNDALEQDAESPSPEADESNADAAQHSNDADSDSAPSPSDDAAGAGLPDTRSNAAASKPVPADAVAYRYREWDIYKN
ncbi:MAG: hypothetical protein ABJE47_20875, partial [bacterium]